jgi:hypothetical protein
MVQEFCYEREDQQIELRELHAYQADPQSIKGIVDTNITSHLRQLTSDMEEMVSTCRFMPLASNMMFTMLKRLIEDSVQSHKKLSARIDAALQHQQTQMLKLIDGVNDHNAEQVKQKEHLNHVEVLFAKLDKHLSELMTIVKVCTAVGTNVDDVSSKITQVLEHAESATLYLNKCIDTMDETIQDTFLNFKVDGITTKMALLEDSLTTRITEVDEALKHIATNILQPSGTISGAITMQGIAPDTTRDDLKPAASGGMELTDDVSLPWSRFPPFKLYRSSSSFLSGNWYPHPQKTWFPPNSCTQQKSVDAAYDTDRECHEYNTHQNFGHPHSLPYRHTSGLHNVSTDGPHGDWWSKTDHHMDWAMDDDNRTYASIRGPIKSPSYVEHS